MSERRLIIQMKGVSFSYGQRNILRSLNFELLKNQFASIVGKSGSGKTTILKILSGLLKAHGHISVLGKTRMVFQHDSLFPWFSVQRNIEMGLLNQTEGNASAKSLAYNLLADFDLAELANRYPNQLSGGEKQRVAIARAFAAQPDIVFMDEPFGALDVITRSRMQNWLLNFKSRFNTSIVFVTHDVEEGLLLSDKISILKAGSLVKTLDLTFNRLNNPDVKFTDDFLDARKQLSAELLTNG